MMRILLTYLADWIVYGCECFLYFGMMVFIRPTKYLLFGGTFSLEPIYLRKRDDDQ